MIKKIELQGRLLSTFLSFFSGTMPNVSLYKNTGRIFSGKTETEEGWKNGHWETLKSLGFIEYEIVEGKRNIDNISWKITDLGKEYVMENHSFLFEREAKEWMFVSEKESMIG